MSFPLAPTVGQQHTLPSGSTYEFTATGAWKKINAAGGTGLPADAVGVLTNDGVGGLSWETEAALSDRVYSIEDDTFTTPLPAFGTDGETVIMSNTAGDTYYRFTKRAGVWVADPLNGAGGTGDESPILVDQGSITAPAAFVNVLWPDNTKHYRLYIDWVTDAPSNTNRFNFLDMAGVEIKGNSYFGSFAATISRMGMDSNAGFPSRGYGRLNFSGLNALEPDGVADQYPRVTESRTSAYSDTLAPIDRGNGITGQAESGFTAIEPTSGVAFSPTANADGTINFTTFDWWLLQLNDNYRDSA